MASRIGMSYRNEASQGRIDAALAALVSRFAVEVGPLAGHPRAPLLAAAIRLEWTADVLEAVAASSGVPVATDSAEGGDPASAEDDLMAHTRDELNAMADELGIEDVASLPNKGAVADAITAAKGN